MSTAAVGDQREVPANGIRGLKYLRYDIMSGIVVSLVSLPLSSGIAIASGVPPIYGLISAIIAGLIFPLIGGSYMTISGPAAGLAPALLAARRKWIVAPCASPLTSAVTATAELPSRAGR